MGRLVWCPRGLGLDEKGPGTERQPQAVTEGIQALEPLRSDAYVGTLSMTPLAFSFLICKMGDSCLLYRVDVQVTRNSTRRAPCVVPEHVNFIPSMTVLEGKEIGSPDSGKGGSKRGQGQVALQIHCFPA